VDVREGEEHVGLVQALMSAGARAVVTSLWSVDDEPTRVLFEAFYAEVSEGRSPVEALASAARTVRKRRNWSHPYYWAAFQASGLAAPSAQPEAAS
jgi:CHAT domain-containing protein